MDAGFNNAPTIFVISAKSGEAIDTIFSISNLAKIHSIKYKQLLSLFIGSFIYNFFLNLQYQWNCGDFSGHGVCLLDSQTAASTCQELQVCVRVYMYMYVCVC